MGWAKLFEKHTKNHPARSHADGNAELDLSVIPDYSGKRMFLSCAFMLCLCIPAWYGIQCGTGLLNPYATSPLYAAPVALCLPPTGHRHRNQRLCAPCCAFHPLPNAKHTVASEHPRQQPLPMVGSTYQPSPLQSVLVLSILSSA